MSVTTTPRVDATHPVLSQLVDAASKGFTGSLEVTASDSAGRDLQVVVWLREGDVYAVHANGWTPPATAYVLAKTGADFTGRAESAFQLAFETERDGQPLLNAAELDAPRRDWAYGLLAASLTWNKPKVRRRRGATTEVNRMNPSAWERVTADVAARVDGLESAWRVVCDSLTAAGIRPVPAGRACAMLTVNIANHPLFTGSEALDQVAGRAGLSRYVVLEELSRALLLGAVPQFAPVAPVQEPLLVPEHWEDPARSWGWVAEAPADAEEPEPEAEPEVELEVADEAEPELETAVEPVPEQADAEPVEQVEAPRLTVVPDLPAGGPESARELINEWLLGSTDASDAGVRGAIVHRLVTSARAESEARTREVTRAADDLDLAEGEVEASVAGTARASEVLAAAEQALAQAESQVARVQEEFADVVQSQADAAEHAEHVAQAADAEEAALAVLLEQVEAQRAIAAAARTDADRANEVALAAQVEVDELAAPAFAAARELTEVVRTSSVVPARAELGDAQARAEAALLAVARARSDLQDRQAAAAGASDVAESLHFAEAA